MDVERRGVGEDRPGGVATAQDVPPRQGSGSVVGHVDERDDRLRGRSRATAASSATAGLGNQRAPHRQGPLELGYGWTHEQCVSKSGKGASDEKVVARVNVPSERGPLEDGRG